MLKLIFQSPLGLVLIIALGYAFYNPAIIPDSRVRGFFEKTKNDFLAKNPDAGKKVLGAIDNAKNKVVEMAQTTKLPKELTGEKKEIVVDEYVSKLTEQIKQLPSEQLKNVKISFCQDVIDEATQSSKSE